MSVPVPVFGGGPGSGHFPPLLIANNLADIQFIPAALANLGIGAISTSGTVTTFPGSLVVPSGITMQNLTASVVVSTSGGILQVVTASGAAATGAFKPTSFYPVTISGTTFYAPLCSGAW